MLQRAKQKSDTFAAELDALTRNAPLAEALRRSRALGHLSDEADRLLRAIEKLMQQWLRASDTVPLAVQEL